MWFDELTGCTETTANVARLLQYRDGMLHCQGNGATYQVGQLTAPSLADLRKNIALASTENVKLQLSEKIADVQSLHRDPANAGALFQVASQFNLLEMTSPDVSPEQGVSGYHYDKTQGPACAIACGAGTIYRNYFVQINESRGQTADRQLNMISDLGDYLASQMNMTVSELWRMRNGYLLPSTKGLNAIANYLNSLDENALDTLRSLLRIGLQSNTQVTLQGSEHCVSQAYCSALPVAYCDLPIKVWQPFAQLVLDAAYEATFAAAVINHKTTGNPRLFLTLLGGGVFGNRIDWIIKAIQRSCMLYKQSNLEVFIVSYGRSKPEVRQLIKSLEPPATN